VVLLEPATGPTRHINIVEGASSCFSENKVSILLFLLVARTQMILKSISCSGYVCSEEYWRTVSSVRTCGICGAVSA
jgi:hypothetical protein